MRCESCGTEFRGNYGEACPACGTVAQNPFAGSSSPPPQQDPFAQPAQPQGPSPWQSPRTAPSSMDGAPAGEGGGIPWETEQSAQSMFETIKAVLLQSQDTFARANRTMGIGPAFTYALILGIAGGLIGQLWSLGMNSAMTGLSGMENMGGIAALGTGVAGFLLVPVWVAIGLFVSAGLVHLSLMMVGGANAGFESTFRVIAFAQGSAAPLQIVPVLGIFAQLIWAIVIEIMGIKEMHNTTTGKAAAAVLLPVATCCCCIVAGIASVSGIIANATQGM